MVAFALSIALVAFVAAANIVLGFAAAWMLGRGPHRWTLADYQAAEAAWEAARLGVIPVVEETVEPAQASSTEPIPAAFAAPTPQDQSLTGLIRKCKSIARDCGKLAKALEENQADDTASEPTSPAQRLVNGVAPIEKFVADAVKRLAARPEDDNDRNRIKRALSATADSAAAARNLAQLSALEQESVTPDDLASAAWTVVESLHGLRDAYEEALCAWERRDLPRHGLAGRFAVQEVAVRWQAESDQPLGCGLIDVDLMTLVNRRQGIDVAERLLAALAETVRSLAQSPNVAAWWSGQQMVLLYPGQPAAGVAAELERLRQTVESTQFAFGEASLRVTLSGAAAECSRHEPWSVCAERLLATVREAKTYGRNRLFIGGDSGPAAMTPLELNLPARTVSL